MKKSELIQLIKEELNRILIEADRFSSAAVFSIEKDLRKKLSTATDKYWAKVDQYNAAVDSYRVKNKEVQSDINDTVNDMENDPDVIKNLDGKVAQQYGDKLNKLYDKMSAIRLSLKKYEDQVDSAQADMDIASRKFKDYTSNLKKLFVNKNI